MCLNFTRSCPENHTKFAGLPCEPFLLSLRLGLASLIESWLIFQCGPTQLSSEAIRNVLDETVRHLMDSHAPVRIAAVNLISQLGVPHARRTQILLGRFTRDPDPRVRRVCQRNSCQTETTLTD